MDKLLKALENKDSFSALLIYNMLLNNGVSHDEIMTALKENGYETNE